MVVKKHSYSWLLFFLLTPFKILGQAPPRPSQETQAQRFTLDQALEFAQKNYPAIRAAQERVSAARAGVAASVAAQSAISGGKYVVLLLLMSVSREYVLCRCDGIRTAGGPSKFALSG